MHKASHVLRGLSTCLRYHYRLVTNGSSPVTGERRRPRRELRRFTCQRPVNQGATLQHISDNLIHLTDDRIKYGQHNDPIITYEPRGSATSARTQARKHSLGLDVLGKPAEILVVQHEGDRQRSNRLYVKGVDNDPKENLYMDSSQLLEAINKERGIIGFEQVCQNIEDLRQSILGQRSYSRGLAEDSVLEDLASKLRNGFTASQLSAYLRNSSHEIVVDPFNLQQDYTCRLYSRSSWKPGTSSISHHRAPSLLENNSKAEGSSHGVQRPRKDIKKDELIGQIIHQHWHLKPLSEESLQGEVDIGLLSIHFDLITNHRKNILKKSSETYGVKIEAFRSEQLIRVSSDFDACGDIFRLFKYMIENVKYDTIHIEASDTDATEDTSRIAVISQIEKLTSTVIREVEEPQPQGLAKRKLSIYYLGSEALDLEDARRMLMAVEKRSGIRNRKLLWVHGTSVNKIIASPVDAGTHLAMKDRHIEWSRWCATSSFRPDGETESIFSDKPSTTKWKEKVLPSIIGFLKTYDSKPKVDLSKTESPFWKQNLSFTTVARLGQVIFPSSMTKEIQRNLPKQMTSTPTATQFEAALDRSGREFLTVAAGIFKPLSTLDGESTEFENLFIILSPSLPLNPSLEMLDALPSLELEIDLDSRKQDITLSAARLIMEDAEMDVLLPSNNMDIRLSKRTFVRSAVPDSALFDFVKSSSLNIWGNDRLTTPNDLTLTVPPHTLRVDPKREKDMYKPKDILERGLSVQYTFTRLEHRSTIRTSFMENTQVDYTIIEAGRTGGRREELSITNRPRLEEESAGFSKDNLVSQSEKQSNSNIIKGRRGKKLSPEDSKAKSLWRAANQLISDTEKPWDQR